MNNIVANFEQILEFAKSYGLPLTKKRAILREYLQSKILEIIYQQKVSLNLFFVGGTSLRLLRGLDRFSEDLDFDFVDTESLQIDTLMNNLVKQLKQENIQVDFYRNKTEKRVYYELRFKDLLYELGISSNPQEKLMIKFDFENFWQEQKREVVLFNRYGFLTEMVTVPLDQILVQKLFAYLNRKQTLPRDIYDIVWLYSQGARVDWEYVKANHLPKYFLKEALIKFQQEEKNLRLLRRKLRPFLVNETNVEKLSFFPKLITQLLKQSNN